MENRKYDLEDRLIQFALDVIFIAEQLPNTYVARHFGNQLVRSGSAPAFHYLEAKSAESRRDFIHKLKIGLKELRESFTNLKIIQRKPLLEHEKLGQALKECEELISIFVKSIKTSQKNMAEDKLRH